MAVELLNGVSYGLANMTKSRVLVVDDDESNRRLVRRVLEALPYEIVEAEDGERALEEVALAPPDVILLDLEMPRRDGYSVLRHLKGDARTRLIPVIMVTSHDQLAEKVRAVAIGADDYILKPFNIVELAARVKALAALKRFTDELENAGVVLESIGLTVEARDRYTGDHCRRVAECGVRIGALLGVGEEDRRILRLSGFLHDLGKVAISDGILNKPGPLAPGEFAVMKSHPSVGADLVKHMRTMEAVVPLIRHHHEKLDGSGYPDGLRGDEIPLLVRITSVVDVFDALRTRRSYKQALPVERCLAILREEAARGWWDSDVVEAMARLEAEQTVARA